MITFFTTFRKYSRAEKNAVESWLALNDQIQVIAFTETENTMQWNLPKRVVVSRNFQRHETGLPLLNTIFAEASRVSNFSLLCYCNSDIIVLPEFMERIKPLINLKKNFLAISQRIDAGVNLDMDFSKKKSISDLNEIIATSGKVHIPLGSDIFLFPRHQYTEENMPPLVVGRPAWDNWMLYNARLRFNMLVDLTGIKPAIVHQDHPASYNPTDPKDQVNVHFLPEGHPYTFVLEYCNYMVRNGKLKRLPAKIRDVNRVQWELVFNKNNIRYYYYYFLLLIFKVKFKLSHY